MNISLILKAMADETRMRIINLLLEHNYCVRGLAKNLNISEAAVSQQVKVLKEAGLLIGCRQGYYMHYEVDRYVLEQLSDAIQALAKVETSPCTPREGRCQEGSLTSSCQKPARRVKTILKRSKNMKLAVTFENGEVFQHFGHTEAFKIYEVEGNKVISSEVVSTNGSGHSALAEFLGERQVEALICGGIGGGAKNALSECGIAIYPGVSGNADEQVEKFLANELNYNPDTQCSHHDHDHEECGEHDSRCGGHCH